MLGCDLGNKIALILTWMFSAFKLEAIWAETTVARLVGVIRSNMFWVVLICRAAMLRVAWHYNMQMKASSGRRTETVFQDKNFFLQIAFYDNAIEASIQFFGFFSRKIVKKH